MSYFYSSEIGYYEGDRISLDDTVVPKRPDKWSIWNGKEWKEGSPPKDNFSIDQFKTLLENPSVKEWLSTQILKTND